MRPLGIVLAGGRGERMRAGSPKALVVLGGRTLLDRAVATLASLCAEVAVVAPEAMDVGSASAIRVFDVPGFEGPLAGLVAGLEWAGEEEALVLGVDFPCVGGDLPRMLVVRLDASRNASPSFDAIVPRPDGIAQPLVAAYAPTAAGALRIALESGVRSLRSGLDRLHVDWLDDAVLAAIPGGTRCLLNVNTPDDLALATERLAAAGDRT